MSTQSDAEYLRARYGGGGTQDRRTLWIIASSLIMIALGWFAWQALALNTPAPTAEPLAMNVISDQEVEVTYNLTAEIGSVVTCTVTAVNDSYTEVGVRQVTVGPTDREVTAVTTRVATIQRAAGANVEGCTTASP